MNNLLQGTQKVLSNFGHTYDWAFKAMQCGLDDGDDDNDGDDNDDEEDGDDDGDCSGKINGKADGRSGKDGC